ncbi:hypothetical protein [Streptomyces sp. NPDC048361]|uniref:hypothetical protein n=1 Tax=Streptomyces sp. NPDC048361 TaxID=3154720 RepID=UPI0034412FA1
MLFVYGFRHCAGERRLSHTPDQAADDTQHKRSLPGGSYVAEGQTEERPGGGTRQGVEESASPTSPADSMMVGHLLFRTETMTMTARAARKPTMALLAPDVRYRGCDSENADDHYHQHKARSS